VTLWLAVVAGPATAQEPAPAAPPDATQEASPSDATQPAAPQGGSGTIAGKVIDAASGDAMIDAGVEVVGTKKSARTDIDGKFSFQLPPGHYDVRVFAPGYRGTRVQGVSVVAGKVARADATLAPTAEAGVEVVEVVAKADKAAEATQIIQRQKADVVEDNVSAQIIQKSPDSTAAEVVQRVPAVTVKDDKYIFVRGLGERYSSAILNGSRLPSTDPDRRVVALDLFPSQFIESLNIIKTYSPDLPGDFSGGLVDIHLRDFPDKLSYSIGIDMGGNTNTTFQPFQTYHGAFLDYFGIDTIRGLPSVIPKSGVNAATPEQNQIYGRSFKDIWEVNDITAPPNFGVNFTIGDKIGDLGVNLAGLYSTEYKTRWGEIAKQFKNGGDLQNPTFKLIDDYLVNSGDFQTKLGGILTSAYDITPNDRVSFRAFYDQNSTDETDLAVGHSEPLNFERINQQTLLQFTQDALAFGQLEGQHHYANAWVDWRSAFSQTTRDVPDTRILVYSGDPGGPLSFTDDANSGVRAFQNLRELLSDSALDVTVPFLTGLPFTDAWDGLEAKFKTGAAYSYRSRNYDQRVFHFRNGPLLADQLEQPPDVLFQPDNIGPGKFKLFDETLPRDNFEASQEISGGYVMWDLPIVKDLVRLVAGVRVENSYIVAKFFNDFLNKKDNSIKNNTDPLPAINVVYSPRSDMNVRVAWSKTVSRPDFRELSPTEYPTLRGFRPVIGNPALVEAHIDSVDLRWDWFYSPLELFSFSLFHKNLDQPIETVLLQQSSDVANSFENAESGTLNGLEFEMRKDLSPLSPLLQNVSVIYNASYVNSNVKLPADQQFQVQTSLSRPLQGQAPWTMNAAVEYKHPFWGIARLLYNTAGRELAFLGGFQLPDIYEESRQQLDFVWLNDVTILDWPVTIKFSAENLLNDRYQFTQGPELQSQYKTGVTFTMGIDYRY
jgi:hypothetical protein